MEMDALGMIETRGLVGMIEAMSDSRRRVWLDHLRALGRQAA